MKLFIIGTIKYHEQYDKILYINGAKMELTDS
jgi:hypothetical protein